MNPTIVDAQPLSAEETSALKKQHTRKLARVIMTRVAIGTAVVVGSVFLFKKLDTNNALSDALTEIE